MQSLDELPVLPDLSSDEGAEKLEQAISELRGRGEQMELTDPEEKRRGLASIMGHLSGRTDWSFPDQAVRSTAVYRLDVTELSCKEHA